MPAQQDSGFKYYNGVPLPAIIDDQNVWSAINYKAKPGERYVVTYPKCGTTWTQAIIHLLAHDGDPKDMTFHHLQTSQPFIDLFGAEHLDQIKDPKKKPVAIKTHFPFSQTPYHPEARYLYVARNPKDACVSYYHHDRNLHMWRHGNESFGDYFERFIEGRVDWGDYFEHVAGWWTHRDDPNVTFMTYEWMKANPREAVLKVAQFLGDEYYQKVKSDEALLERVLKHSSFEYMKQLNGIIEQEHKKRAETNGKMDDRGDVPPNFKRAFAAFSKNKQENDKWLQSLTPEEREQLSGEKGRFFRNGRVNDWKNYFTPEQNQRLKAKFEKYAREYGIDKIWSDLSWL